MKLYHGSNVVVQNPKILEKKRALDFGAGFYLTSRKVQAISWAKSVARRRRIGNAIINEYNFDEKIINDLKILKFDSADGEWLDFVVANRKELPIENKYDLVIGPVANDSTLDVINDYMSGRFSKKIAVELLLPQNLTDQYAFLTEKSLLSLMFERSGQI